MYFKLLYTYWLGMRVIALLFSPRYQLLSEVMPRKIVGTEGTICNIVRSSVILLLPLFKKVGFIDEWLSQVESERIGNVSKYSTETDSQQHFSHWNLMRSCYEISFNQYLQINVFYSLNCSRSCCWYRKRQ